MRNTAMSDKLNKALKNSKTLKTTKTPSKDQTLRRERVSRAFSRHISEVLNIKLPPVEEVPPPLPEPSILEPPKIPEPEPHEVEEALAKIAEAETPALPSDLQWLGQSTPFQVPITAMVGSLRDAKTRLNLNLEVHLKTAAKKQEEFDRACAALEAEQKIIHDLRGKLGKLEETISACAMLSEQSADIADLLVKTKLQASRVKMIRSPDDPGVCRMSDLRNFFDRNPNINFTAAEIVPELPAIKQAHARQYISQMLCQVNKEGWIQRVDRGVYRRVG